MSEFVSVKYITLTTDTYYNFKKVQEDSSIRGITQVKNAATNYQNLMICKKSVTLKYVCHENAGYIKFSVFA